jgi:hypothetical protein
MNSDTIERPRSIHIIITGRLRGNPTINYLRSALTPDVAEPGYAFGWLLAESDGADFPTWFLLIAYGAKRAALLNRKGGDTITVTSRCVARFRTVSVFATGRPSYVFSSKAYFEASRSSVHDTPVVYRRLNRTSHRFAPLQTPPRKLRK